MSKLFIFNMVRFLKANITFFIGIFALIVLLGVFTGVPFIKKYNFNSFLDKIQSSENFIGSTLVVGAKYDGENDFLIDYNSGRRVHPGSNFKLFTAAASLHYLGPNFVFKTQLFLQEKIGRNDLILVGSGDPSLRKKDLVGFVDAVKKAGLKVDNIFYDDSVFEGEKFGPGWPESWKDQYFAVPITGLQLDDNLLSIIAYEDSETGKFEISTSPIEDYPLKDERVYYEEFKYLKVPVTAVMRENDEVVLMGDAVKNLPFITSSTIKDPSKFTALALKQELLKENLISPYAEVEKNDFWVEGDGDFPVYSHKSADLKHLIAQMLKFSKNNYAETLVRTLGREVGSEGTQKAGVEVLEDFFDEIGIEPGSISVFDGSGLSPNTRVTGYALMDLFDYIEDKPWKIDFWASLPESMVDGTLKYRFENAGLNTQVFAKTGSHDFASSLSGKILNPGKDIIFTVHVYNHHFSTEESAINIVPVIDRIVALLEKQW